MVSFILNLSTNGGKWFTSHPSSFPTPLQKQPQDPLNRRQDCSQTQPGSFGGDKNENLLSLPGITPWLIQLVPYQCTHYGRCVCVCVCVYCTRSAFLPTHPPFFQVTSLYSKVNIPCGFSPTSEFLMHKKCPLSWFTPSNEYCAEIRQTSI